MPVSRCALLAVGITVGVLSDPVYDFGKVDVFKIPSLTAVFQGKVATA